MQDQIIITRLELIRFVRNYELTSDVDRLPRYYNCECFVFFFKKKTAYEITVWLEFRRVLFRSLLNKSQTSSFPLINYCLARCYNLGLGIPPNQEMALLLYKKAAKNSSSFAFPCKKTNINAQCFLGKCYYEGIGVEKIGRASCREGL